MEFDSVIKKRRSVRSFKGKSVNWRRAIDLIEAANHNPFAGNINALKYVIVESKNTIKRIAEHAEQPWIENSPLAIVICSNEIDLENLYGERGRVYSRQQAGAVVQTMLLKLVDLKLAGCWVGAYSEEEIRRLLKIPNHIQIEAILAIGHADEERGIIKKKSIEATIYWEKWSAEKKPETFFKEPEDQYQLKK